MDVRDGAKGPLVVEIIKRPVAARTPQRQEGHGETLVVIRYRDRDQHEVVKIDFYLSNGAARRRWRSWRAWPRRRIVLKNASNAARVKRVWPTMKCAIGRAGIIIKPFR